MMLAANVHVGSKNADAGMARYIYKRRADGEPRPAAPFLPTQISLVCEYFESISQQPLL
jgi:hypothetical protein